MPRASTETPRATRVADIRKGDTVVVLHGKDAGKRGTVDHMVRPDRVLVQGLNVAKRHTKPRRIQGRTESAPRIQQGGILDKPLPLYMGNVMVVCPACSTPSLPPARASASAGTVASR